VVRSLVLVCNLPMAPLPSPFPLIVFAPEQFRLKRGDLPSLKASNRRGILTLFFLLSSCLFRRSSVFFFSLSIASLQSPAFFFMECPDQIILSFLGWVRIVLNFFASPNTHPPLVHVFFPPSFPPPRRSTGEKLIVAFTVRKRTFLVLGFLLSSSLGFFFFFFLSRQRARLFPTQLLTFSWLANSPTLALDVCINGVNFFSF